LNFSLNLQWINLDSMLKIMLKTGLKFSLLKTLILSKPFEQNIESTLIQCRIQYFLDRISTLNLISGATKKKIFVGSIIFLIY
jgi:hypothetical protein